jgi:hypothetical protein
MTPAEQKAENERQEAARKQEAAVIASAWDALARSKDFEVVFLRDLQDRFPALEASFRGPDYNPYAAAQRDGAKEVIGHIWKRLEAAKKRLRDDAEAAATKPTQAIG